MRGFFQRGAQRDSLRPELKQEFNNNQKDGVKRRIRPEASLKNLVSAFLLAALSNEASHFHVPQNPHGNRRERIEEVRQRLSEAEVNSRSMRSMNAGGHPPEPPRSTAHVDIQGRRRSPGIDAQA